MLQVTAALTTGRPLPRSAFLLPLLQAAPASPLAPASLFLPHTMDTSSIFATSGCCKGSRKGSGPRTTTHSSARRQRGTRVTPERRELSPAPHEPQPTPHACSLYPAPTLHLQKTPCRSPFLTPWSSGAPWCHRCCAGAGLRGGRSGQMSQARQAVASGAAQPCCRGSPLSSALPTSPEEPRLQAYRLSILAAAPQHGCRSPAPESPHSSLTHLLHKANW